MHTSTKAGKRIFSYLLSLTMCLSLLPTAAFAEEQSCVDENHDHLCDTCGEIFYETTLQDDGTYVCAAENCGAQEVFVSGEYTDLTYRIEDEVLVVDGTVQVSVEILSDLDGSTVPVENGSVSMNWTDEEGEIVPQYSVEDAALTDGTASASFTGLPAELLHSGELIYTPAESQAYLPGWAYMNLAYQNNAWLVDVLANVDCTINGVEVTSLYLLEGDQVTVTALAETPGTLVWSYEEESARPDYTLEGNTVTFTMPEGDVYACLERTCETCIDENRNHWCDVCWERLSACADEDGDHFCDLCDDYMSELCTDGADENPHYCDVCWAYMPELCADEDDDHTCDVCGEWIHTLCYDEDDDHFCDNEACGCRLTYCEDWDDDGDNICDLCGESLYPSADKLNVEAEAGDGSITVTWEALGDVGEDSVSAYIVSCYLADAEKPLVSETYDPDSETYSHTFTELENDVLYDVAVSAVYTLISEGYEEPYEAVSMVSALPTSTDADLPGVPDITSVTYGNASVIVEWTAPADNGGAVIRSYNILAEQDTMGVSTSVDPQEGTMRCTLDGLSNGQTCKISVSAVNGVGEGEAATAEIEIPLIPYQLEVGGVAVTEANMADVLGDGTVSYDPTGWTLTLNNASINVTGNYGVRSKTFLTVELIGENRIDCSGVYGFHSTDDVTMTGSGSLTVTAADVGIYIAGGYEVGGLYLMDDVTLDVTSGDVASGNSYGVRVDDVLELWDNAILTAASGAAPERSCGIYAYDEFNVYDDAVVTATGGNQSADLNTDCDGIRTTHITIDGGTVNAVGGTAATSNGIYTQTFDLYSGIVTAESGSTAGGTRGGPSAALQSNRSFYIADGVVVAVAAEAGNDQSCGILVGNGQMTVDGGSLYALSGAANFSRGISADSFFLLDGFVSAESAQGGFLSSGVSVAGSMTVSGGTLQAIAADAETYSYGLQAFDLTMTNGDIAAEAGTAGESYGLWAFGAMNLSLDEITVNPYTPGFAATRVSAASESGYALYSRTGIVIGEDLVLSLPEDGSIAEFGSAEDYSLYYVAVDAGNVPAKNALLELLTCAVSIEGLDLSYDLGVDVPAGWSVNEAYCEKFGVEDFSEILDTTRSGHTFKGWYTDEACTSGNEFSFDDEITEDLTIYAKWSKKASSRPSRPQPEIEAETPAKTFTDVHEADHWAEEAVNFVTEKGIFEGTSEDTFTPDGPMTRQAMWMILARMSGENPATMAEAAAWVVEVGISDGSAPVQAASRQQFVTMLWRWAQVQGMDVSVGEDTNILSYEDAFTVSEYATPAFQWACGAGIVNGYADGTLKPAATAIRAHVAKMLMTFYLNN